MSYKILESPIGDGKILADFLPYHEFAGSWNTGARFQTPPKTPIELTWDPDNESGERVSFYEAGIVLMRKVLLQALEEAGVNNFDTYETVIRSQSGQPDCNDYLAVNIVGAIAAADMDQSETIVESDGMFDVLFGSLVIDEEKAKGQLLFRLAESVTTVVIHESVVTSLIDKGGFGLTFTDPSEYCG